MSSDGVQKPAWYGNGGFSYMMHGPDFRRDGPAATSHNYGEMRGAEPALLGPPPCSRSDPIYHCS